MSPVVRHGLMAEERRRIAHAVVQLRPAWTIEQVDTVMRLQMKHFSYADAAAALTMLAVYRPDIADPSRVMDAGAPWWKATEMLGGSAGPVTQVKHPQCHEHKGCLEHNDHPIGADRCPDCRVALVTDPERARELRETALAEAGVRKVSVLAQGGRPDVVIVEEPAGTVTGPVVDEREARRQELRARIDQSGGRL